MLIPSKETNNQVAMFDTMRRRQFIATASLLSTTPFLSGCNSRTCGPGPTKANEIANARAYYSGTSVTLEGTVQKDRTGRLGDGFFLNDGTKSNGEEVTVVVHVENNEIINVLEDGDCVRVTSELSEDENLEAASGKTNVVVLFDSSVRRIE